MKEILHTEQKDYLDLFDQETDTLLLEMEDFANKNDVPILSRDSARLMELLILINKPERVLELGTAIAYTTIRIARNLKKGSKIHSIEFSENNARLARVYVKKSGLSKRIKLIFGDAKKVMTTLKK